MEREKGVEKREFLRYNYIIENNNNKNKNFMGLPEY